MKRQDRPVHELPSFSRYLNKVFDFRTAAANVTDARVEPDIPPSAVFLATFHGFVFRLRSFQQLEAEISHPAFQNWIGAPRAFRDDVLRYSLCGFSLCPASITFSGRRVDSSLLLPSAARCLMKNVTRPNERDGWQIEEAIEHGNETGAD